MMYRIRNWLVATLLLLCTPVGAATLSDIQVSNGNQQARITLSLLAILIMRLAIKANAPWRSISNNGRDSGTAVVVQRQ